MSIDRNIWPRLALISPGFARWFDAEACRVGLTPAVYVVTQSDGGWVIDARLLDPLDPDFPGFCDTFADFDPQALHRALNPVAVRPGGFDPLRVAWGG